MSNRRSVMITGSLTLAALVVSLFEPGHTQAQGQRGIQYQVTDTSNRMEMVVSTSRVLTMEYNVPDILIANPEIIRAQPISPNQILISALKPGVTHLGIYDERKNVQTIDIHVIGDVRSLQMTLNSLFPEATIRARALNSSVILTGFVPRADMIKQIKEVAEDYFPKVIDYLNVGGAQKILLNVKIVEVSRTKLRRFGADWAVLNGNDFVIQSVSGLLAAAATQGGTLTGAGTSTFRFGVLDGGNQIGAFIDLLEQNNLAKILAEPKLTASSGRPANFLNGGQIPVPVNDGFGVQSVEFRDFGTNVDFVPIVLGNGSIRLEVRSEVTEVATDLRDPVTGTPGFRTRRVDTGVEMRAGQTLALAGLIQNRVDSETRGIPGLMDLPWIGAPFRRVEERFNEIELVIMVTPEFIGEVPPHMVPEGPGQQTVSPQDVDLYWRGYQEVPRCYHPDELGPVIPRDQVDLQSPTPLPPPNGIERFPIEGMPVPSNSLPPNPELQLHPSQQPMGLGVPQPNQSGASIRPALPPLRGGVNPVRYSTVQGGHYPHSAKPVYPANQSNYVYPPNRNLPARDFSRPVVNSSPQFIGRTGYDVIK